MAERFRFRHVNELTGALVLGVLLLVVASVLLTGQSQRWFSRKFGFDIALPEKGAFGLSRGNEVFILGVSAGMVDDIHVGEDGRMKAHVKIRGDFARFVRSDSRATIKKVFGVAGDSFLEISQGRGVPLEKDSVVECLSSEELPGMMEKMVADLRAEVMPVVKKAGVTFDSWSTLGNELKTTQAELRQAIGQLNQMLAGVQEGKGTAGQLLQETALMDEARKLLAQAGGAVSQLQAVLTNAQVAVTNVQVGTVRLPEITDALANEAKDLPGLVLQTQGTMRELERLVEGIQRHWLIRKYVNKTNPPPLHPLPAEEFSRPTPSQPLRSPRDTANKP